MLEYIWCLRSSVLDYRTSLAYTRADFFTFSVANPLNNAGNLLDGVEQIKFFFGMLSLIEYFFMK